LVSVSRFLILLSASSREMLNGIVMFKLAIIDVLVCR